MTFRGNVECYYSAAGENCYPSTVKTLKNGYEMRRIAFYKSWLQYSKAINLLAPQAKNYHHLTAKMFEND